MVVREHVPLQVALRHERLVAALHIALVLVVHLVNALHVHVQVAVAHERLPAVLERTHEPLLVLVVAADVHLQPAVRRVLLVAARVRALEPLRVRIVSSTHLGVARVDPTVLAEVLRVVEGLAAVGEVAHVLLLARVVVNMHVRVQVRLPRELSTPHAAHDRALATAGERAPERLARIATPHSRLSHARRREVGAGVGEEVLQRLLLVQHLRFTQNRRPHRGPRRQQQLQHLVQHVQRRLLVATRRLQQQLRHLRLTFLMSLTRM